MFKLGRPNMAVNDPRTKRRFQMENTWDITEAESREHIIGWVATVAKGTPGRKLKNLVLSCHSDAGYLTLGKGFDGDHHVPLFAGWKGLVEKIWLPNCRVALIDPEGRDGNMFCSSLAKTVQCYVVASTETQCESSVTLPVDQMTSFEGLILSYGPKGNVTWSHRNPSTWWRDGICVRVPD